MPILIPSLDEIEVRDTLDIDGSYVGDECEPFGRWILMRPEGELWGVYPPLPLSPRMTDDLLTPEECRQYSAEFAAAAALCDALNARVRRQVPEVSA